MSKLRTQSRLWFSELVRNLLVAVGLLILVTILGSLGYVAIEGWSLREAFYMSVITLSTVGYGEVQPLSGNGQLFTAGLIMSGVCIAAYSFSIIGQTLLEGELKRFRGTYKMTKKISSLRKHTIICGFGRLARFIIPDLQDRGQQVVVIENSANATAELEEHRVLYILGNAYDEEALKAAGIEHADSLLALLPKDPDNVYVTLVARALNKKLNILARAESPASESKLRLAGANQVVAPYRVSGSRIVQQLLHPVVNDFLEIFTTGRSEDQLVIEQIVIPKGSSIEGVSLADSQIRQKSGITIAAWIEPNGDANLQPSAQDVIKAGSSVIALGTAQAINKFTKLIENESN